MSAENPEVQIATKNTLDNLLQLADRVARAQGEPETFGVDPNPFIKFEFSPEAVQAAGFDPEFDELEMHYFPFAFMPEDADDGPNEFPDGRRFQIKKKSKKNEGLVTTFDVTAKYDGSFEGTSDTEDENLPPVVVDGQVIEERRKLLRAHEAAFKEAPLTVSECQQLRKLLITHEELTP